MNAQTIGNALSLSLAPTIDVSHFDGSLTLSGAITGSYGLTKTGAGLLVLSNVGNTYTGMVSVTGGTLSIGADAHLGNANNAIVLDGGTLRAGGLINAAHAITVGNAGGGTGTLDTAQGLTYGGVISGASATSGFTKTGASRVTLFGDNAYTGGTIINQGELFLDFNSAAPAVASIIESSSSLVLGGYSTSLAIASPTLNAPTLIFSARSNVASTQTFSGLAVDLGNSSLVTRSVGSGAATLALGAITHNPGGVVSFLRFKDAAGSVEGRFTTSTANTNGILGGWAVTHPTAVTGSTFSTPATDWAANDGSGNIVAYTGYTRAGIAAGYGTTSAPTIASDPTRNVKIDAASVILLTSGSTTANSNTITVASTSGLAVGSGITGSGIASGSIITAIVSSTQLTLSDRATATTSNQTFSAAPLTSLVANGVTDVNTIQVTDGRARVIGIGSGRTLRLGKYGGIWNAFAGNKPLVVGVSGADAGTLTAGGAANTPGEIVFHANAFTDATTSITVNSVIADNGTGAVSITKTGIGAMTVNQANSYTGNTYIDQGQLTGNNARSFGGDGTTAGSGTVFVQPGAQAALRGAVGYANDFVIAGSGFNVSSANGAINMIAGATMGTSSSNITLAGDARIGGNASTTLEHTLAGKITGNYNLELTGTGPSAFLLTNPGNDMSGHIGINVISLAAGYAPQVYGNGTIQLRLGASEVIPNG
ncbi:MAG TPA: autotransporter-associated beta strand repeat-containing protein, partial [Chthoniobacterales bacterium]